MSGDDRRLRTIACTGLVLGGIFGMAGTFAPSASLRGLAWGVDGVALVVASALLAVHSLRAGRELVAAGFLVFMVGQGFILSGAPMALEASIPSFGTGAALWAVGLTLISAPRALPLVVRGLGLIAALLFAVVAVRIHAGQAISPLSKPLPFNAYPFLVATLFGWAWVHLRTGGNSQT